jgi:hypothetical protein
MMKKVIKTPVNQRISKATKNSYRFTKGGLAHAHGEKTQSKTDLHPETASSDPPLSSRVSVQTQKKLPIERINHESRLETDISLKRHFSQAKGIIIFMASFCTRNLVLATVEI